MRNEVLCRMKKTDAQAPVFLLEGGDSEWFINYLSYSIGKKCEQSMSIF